jgi:hypothetical protein
MCEVSEILRLSRRVKEVAHDPALRDKAIIELKAAIQAEQDSVRLAIQPFIEHCRELFPFGEV